MKVYIMFRELSILFCEGFNVGKRKTRKKILLGLSLWNKVLFLFNEISGRGGEGVNFTTKLLITREWRTAGNGVFLFCPESGLLCAFVSVF